MISLCFFKHRLQIKIFFFKKREHTHEFARAAAAAEGIELWFFVPEGELNLPYFFEFHLAESEED